MVRFLSSFSLRACGTTEVSLLHGHLLRIEWARHSRGVLLHGRVSNWQLCRLLELWHLTLYLVAHPPRASNKIAPSLSAVLVVRTFSDYLGRPLSLSPSPPLESASASTQVPVSAWVSVLSACGDCTDSHRCRKAKENVQVTETPQVTNKEKTNENCTACTIQNSAAAHCMLVSAHTLKPLADPRCRRDLKRVGTASWPYQKSDSSLPSAR